jgi:hypothetical protein
MQICEANLVYANGRDCGTKLEWWRGGGKANLISKLGTQQKSSSVRPVPPVPASRHRPFRHRRLAGASHPQQLPPQFSAISNQQMWWSPAVNQEAMCGAAALALLLSGKSVPIVDVNRERRELGTKIFDWNLRNFCRIQFQLCWRNGTFLNRSHHRIFIFIKSFPFFTTITLKL